MHVDHRVATDCTGFLNFVDWSQNDAHPMSFGASDTTLANVLNMRNQDCGGPAAIKAAASMFVTWTHFGQRDEVRVLAGCCSVSCPAWLVSCLVFG